MEKPESKGQDQLANESIDQDLKDLKTESESDELLQLANADRPSSIPEKQKDKQQMQNLVENTEI